MRYQSACASIVLSASFFASPALADDLIFADVLNFSDPLGNSIRRVGTDGLGLVTLINTGGGVRGIDVNIPAGLIYWTDVDNFAIRRAHLDGSNQEDLVNSNLGFPTAIRLFLSDSSLFWGDAGNEEMYRANLDGLAPLLMATTVFFRGLAVDQTNARIYWTTSITSTTGSILVSDLAGNNQHAVITPSGGDFKPGNIALDIPGGKIYWTDPVTRFVRRANLDGTNIQNLFNAALIGPPKGIVLDLAAGKIYWGQDVEDESFLFGEIHRMDLDGSNPELVVSNLGSVNDLILIPTTSSCYANCDNSTAPPILNANDFQCFLNSFASGLTTANCDHSTAPPVLNANDFQCFLNAFAAGCP